MTGRRTKDPLQAFVRAKRSAAAREELRELARRLGARLRAVREEAGVTQERLAWDCELTKGFLSQVEAGSSLPSLETLYALAERLDVDVVDPLAFEPDNPQHRLLDAVRSMDGRAARAALRDLGL